MKHNHTVEVGAVEANLRDLKLPMGLKVDEVKVVGKGLHIETKPFEVSLASPGSYEVFVSDASLSEFVAKKVPGNFRNPTISSTAGKLVIRGSVVMLIVLPAIATCTLRIENRSQLFVQLESVQVMGAGATSLVQSQLDKLNPILDIDDFPIRATMESVEIVDGGVHLTGTMAPPSSV